MSPRSIEQEINTLCLQPSPADLARFLDLPTGKISTVLSKDQLKRLTVKIFNSYPLESKLQFLTWLSKLLDADHSKIYLLEALEAVPHDALISCRANLGAELCSLLSKLVTSYPARVFELLRAVNGKIEGQSSYIEALMHSQDAKTLDSYLSLLKASKPKFSCRFKYLVGKETTIEMVYVLLKHAVITAREIKDAAVYTLVSPAGGYRIEATWWPDLKQRLLQYICQLNDAEKYRALSQIVYQDKNSELSQFFHLSRGFLSVSPNRGVMKRVVEQHQKCSCLDARMDAVINGIVEHADDQKIRNVIKSLYRLTVEQKIQVLSYRSYKYGYDIFQVLNSIVDIDIIIDLIFLFQELPFNDRTRAYVSGALNTSMLVDGHSVAVAHVIASNLGDEKAHAYLAFLNQCLADPVLKPKVVKLFLSKTDERWTLGDFIIHCQKENSVRCYMSMLEQCLDDPKWSQKLLQLFSNQDQEGWTFGHRIARHQAQEITAYVTLLQRCFERGEIDVNTLLNLLTRQNSDRETLGTMIARYGSSDAIATYIALLKSVNQKALATGGCLLALRKLCAMQNKKGKDFFDILLGREQVQALRSLQDNLFIFNSKKDSNNYKKAQKLIEDVVTTESDQQQLLKSMPPVPLEAQEHTRAQSRNIVYPSSSLYPSLAGLNLVRYPLPYTVKPTAPPVEEVMEMPSSWVMPSTVSANVSTTYVVANSSSDNTMKSSKNNQPCSNMPSDNECLTVVSRKEELLVDIAGIKTSVSPHMDKFISQSGERQVLSLPFFPTVPDAPLPVNRAPVQQEKHAGSLSC